MFDKSRVITYYNLLWEGCCWWFQLVFRIVLLLALCWRYHHIFKVRKGYSLHMQSVNESLWSSPQKGFDQELDNVAQSLTHFHVSRDHFRAKIIMVFIVVSHIFAIVFSCLWYFFLKKLSPPYDVRCTASLSPFINSIWKIGPLAPIFREWGKGRFHLILNWRFPRSRFGHFSWGKARKRGLTF